MRTNIIIAALCALSAVTATGAVIGTITNNKGDVQKGAIKWSARHKAYVVTKGQVEIQIKASDVADIQVPKPATFDPAVAQVNSGQGAAAVQTLQNIVNEYDHLDWDKRAGRYLAEAYLAAERPNDALKACDAIIAGEPSAAYKGDLAPAYWSALLSLGRRSSLEKNVEKALNGDDRFSRGAALIMTGDILKKDGNGSAAACKKALIDGYLRVVYLYGDPDVAERLRPEALYKAAACFDKIGRSEHAEAMREELKSSYAASPWANK